MPGPWITCRLANTLSVDFTLNKLSYRIVCLVIVGIGQSLTHF